MDDRIGYQSRGVYVHSEQQHVECRTSDTDAGAE
ncbi:MAG: hypothetical protein K0R47_5648, partial [Brevibacillus sp.]|nr:hypothetical protein [Brevibacillus sp.]